MPGVQQDILVKIRVLLEGLGNVRALAGHVKELSAGGGGQVAALSGDIDKLAAAVDKLATASEKSSKGGGFLRFLTGTAAVVSILASLPRAFEGVGKLLDLGEAVKDKFGSAFEAVTGIFARAGAAVKGAVSSVTSSVSEFATGVGEKAGTALSGLGGGLAALGPVLVGVGVLLGVVTAALAVVTAGFIGLAAAVGVGAVALSAIARQGIEAQRQLETVRLGIAAIITSLAQVKVGGLPVEGAEKFAAAAEVARAQVQKLRVDAINTTATFEQIAPAFQAALAPGLAAGLNLDEIRGITVKVVQAAGALGIPFEQVNQEVRAILEGTINEDARLAKVLGISNKMVASWKAQGTLAAELNKRLEGFATAGEAAADTFDGLTSNMQEALNVFSSQATARTFDALKDQFRRLLPQLFDFKSAGINAEFQTLAELADDVLSRVVGIAGEIAQGIVSGLRQAGEFVSRNRATINEILNLVEGLARLILGMVGTVAQIVTESGALSIALQGVRGVLLIVDGLLAVILVKLREMKPLLTLLVLAASVAAAGPLGLGAGAGDGLSEVQRARLQLESEKSKLSPEELRERGFVSDIAVGGGGAAGGGKKGGGGGGQKSRAPELQRNLDRARVETDLARLRAEFDLIKQDIQESVDSIRNGLDDAILSISDAYRLEAAFADKALQTEKERIQAELDAAKKRRDLAVQDLDPNLRPDERKLAVAVEDQKLQTEIVRLEGERRKLVEETANRKAALVREEAKAQEDLERSVADIENQLDSLSRFGSTRAEAAAREIEARFAETRRQLVANFGEASAQVRTLDALIQKLSQRAKFEEISEDISAKFSVLRDAEELLSIGVEQGQIKARDATKRRIELELELKRSLRDEIEGLAEIARRTQDPALLAAVRKLQIEWSQLGKVINETAKGLDDALRSGLEDTLVNIVTRTKSIGEAFRDLAQTILAEIARIAAANIIETIFGGLLNTGSGNSIGGILAKILGSGTPKPSGSPSAPGSGIENRPLVIFQGRSSSQSSSFDPNPSEAISGVGDDISHELGHGFGSITNTTGEVKDVTEAGFGQVGAKLTESIGLLRNMVGGSTAGTVAAFADLGLKVLGTLFGGEGGGNKEGGYITGPGTDTSDSILSRLSNGEFVIKAASVRSVGLRVLEHINDLGAVPPIPAFARGGLVGNVELPAPDFGGGGDLHVHMHGIYPVQGNGRLTKQGEAALERDAARATNRGVRRSVASNK